MHFTMKRNLLVIAVAMAGCIGLAPSGQAASATVSVGSTPFAFTPATTNINVGDQVIWVWGGTFHSTTSGTVTGSGVGAVATPDGLWNSTLITSLPHSFTNTFNSPGTFPYYCSQHFSSGMKGAIIVAAPNSPPVVTITNPAPGTVLAAPANVTIQASATDNVSVTNVQFLVGSTVLTNKAAAPFFAVTNNLPAGNYTLSAIASDNLGAKNTNSVTISVVTPVLLLISAPQKIAANFQLSYSVNTGLTYIVQRSTNLIVSNWISILTNKASSNPVVFVDGNTTNRTGFYRVGRLPNP
jgi:plastocyanin